MSELQRRAIGERQFGAAKRWGRLAAMATFALMAAACHYESDVALHHHSEAVRSPHLVGEAWDGNCQRIGETQICLFPIRDQPRWLTARQTNLNGGYLYVAIPRDRLAQVRTYQDGRAVILAPSEERTFASRPDLDRALGRLILMYEALDRLPAAERCRLPVDALTFRRPQSWGCGDE